MFNYMTMRYRIYILIVIIVDFRNLSNSDIFRFGEEIEAISGPVL